MKIRVLLTWILFVPVAIVNGIIRESLYGIYTGDLPAHQISTLTAILAYLFLSYVMMRPVIKKVMPVGLASIGLTWVLMTITFEFLFGHYVDGASWSELWADYNIFAGHWWGLFLLFIGCSPFLIKRLAERTK